MAPELYKREKYGVKVDVWAVGVLLYTIFARNFPFKVGKGEKTPKEAVLYLSPDWSKLE